MTREPTVDELTRIVERLTGAKGLLVSVQIPRARLGKYTDGPHFVIAGTIYEGQPARAAEVLWEEIQAHDVALLLTDFAGINLLHSKEPLGGPVHDFLEGQCLTDEQRGLVLKSNSSQLMNRVQLFQQLGILIAMKAIVSCVPSAKDAKPRPTWLSIGTLAMADVDDTRIYLDPRKPSRPWRDKGTSSVCLTNQQEDAAMSFQT
jgi:hypothetical protein